jgi:peroxiredoxin family protein
MTPTADSGANSQTTPLSEVVSNGTAHPADRLAELESRLARLEAAQAEMRADVPENRVALVVFSGDLDKVLASFVIATGAAAVGMQVSMFFTFWGLSALKKGIHLKGKGILEKAFTLLTPGSSASLGLSQHNFAGIGARLMRRLMRQKEIASLEELMQLAREMGVRFVGCQMSMDVMGVTREELLDNVELGGVATYLADASRSKVTLFI